MFIPDMDCSQELIIPTPWGHIAAKAWGAESKPRVLAIHGLNDNSGSFDQLVPLLGNSLRVVCVDLPGHGLSSHLPPGLAPSMVDLVFSLRRVTHHLQWHSFHVLAHSLGAHLSLYFTSLFGPLVTSLFLVDPFIATIVPDASLVVDRCISVHSELSRIENRTSRSFTYEETIRKLSDLRQKKLDARYLEALQKRAFKETHDGYSRNNDDRMTLLMIPIITPDFHFGMIKNISCPVMTALSTEFEPFRTPTFKDTFSGLKRKLGRGFRQVNLQGCHDLHMDQPQLVAPLVRRFFLPDSHL